MTTTIRLIQTGLVRNLQKKTYWLRVPQDPRQDRVGYSIPIPPNQDAEIDYRDWVNIEHDLIIKDNLKILKIIRYPQTDISTSNFNVIINYTDLPTQPTAGSVVWVQYGDYQGLYFYDVVRNSWLSDSETLISWSSPTDIAAHTVNLVYNANETHQDNNTEVVTPITITAMAASQVNPLLTGESTRFSINSYDLTSGTVTSDVASIALVNVGDRGVKNTSFNFQLNGGAVISASRIKLSGTDKITRPALTIWYRKRLLP